ncbi:uncharacterized protein LOC141710661 [Apium graveolens]|uniref:uncharacterized protein LOC141710661 n=1 Tax=Apium graveolens TaxID=4045 RepID=UPI003D7BECAA
MEENPSKNPWKNEARKPNGDPRAGEDCGGDGQPKCSGKSCTAGVIADCVALCCCPCALVNLLTLAFVKVPYMIGKKCLIKRKRKNKKKVNGVESQRSEEVEWVKNESNWGGRLEEEKIWLELYQIGHLGFGRLSFTELQSLGKDN